VRAFDGFSDVGDDTIAPAVHLVTEDPQATRQIARPAPIEPRRDRFEDAPVEPRRLPAGTQGQPLQIDAGRGFRSHR
jgi:hypothetical protein